MAGLTPELRAGAARFRAAELRPNLLNPMVRPRWIGDTDRFWFPRETADGIVVTEVDAATGALFPATKAWADASARGRPGEAVSPDGRWAAFRHGHDLWLRDLTTDVTRALTNDGAPHYAYGKSPDMNLTAVTLARKGIVLPAAVCWSPDSRRLFTCRLDERAVLELSLLQHVPGEGAVRPVVHTLRVAFSGDEAVPMAEPVIIDVATGAITRVAVAPEIVFVAVSAERNEAWWSADGRRTFHLARDRAQQHLALWETDAATGAARAVITERADTFIDVNLSVTGLPNICILDHTDEFIWFSQRDGRVRLYLHDLATGALKHTITSGNLIVRDIAHVDEAGRAVLFLAGGLDPDPALRKLCRIGLDGSGFAVLTPEPGEHEVAMPRPRPPRDHIRPAAETGWFLSPSGKYFVETHGALDRAPVSVVRRIDGSVIAEIARAEPPSPWRWPLTFTARAADGETDLFGAIWLPTDFDPARRYPVIDNIYPGPQRGNLPATMLPDSVAELSRTCMPQSFAELGFAVVIVDGRGAPLRDKAFHDLSYGKLQDPGCLADHVAVLRELAQRHSWLDIGRVGIMGHSGGGYASVRAMLDYPDVFHAAVATSGNHNQKGYSFAWCEKYQGLVASGGANYAAAANPPFVGNLRGKLLLATGDMDDNVHPALTLQLVDALVRADKDFELIVLPNEDHTSVWSNPYFLRRAMDFMLRSFADPNG